MPKQDSQSADLTSTPTTGRHAFRWHAAALAGPLLLGGCVTLSDSQILAQNLPGAVHAAETFGASALDCPEASGSVLSQGVVYSAPLGYMYGSYTIKVSGCSRQAVYVLRCRDETFCTVPQQTGHSSPTSVP